MKRVPFLFSGGNPMAARHRAFAWSTSPIGAPEQWDTALKTLVPIMLASNQPMFIAWGTQRTLLYNDAYGEILGNKHPAALGHDFLEVWSEIRADLDSLTETEIVHDGRRFLVRSAPRPAASLALRAAGVTLPPTVQALAAD